jgi:hypothetical protein
MMPTTCHGWPFSTTDPPTIPGRALDPSVVPVTKTLFIDLLDPAYKVSATQTIKDVIPEKIEGMAWGPDLKDGRHVLYVFSDNDLFPGLPTQVYAFAIDGAAANIKRCPQIILFPVVSPLDFLFRWFW